VEDVGDGDLDAAAVGELCGVREFQGGDAGLACGEFAGRDRAARGVVEVAEGFAAQAGTAATAAIHVNVTALEAGFGVGIDAEIGLL
jgi:hypothetical protein